MDVAPVSAMVWAGLIDMMLAICLMIGCGMVVDKFSAALTMSEWCHVRFDAMTSLSLSLSTLVQSAVFGVGYDCMESLTFLPMLTSILVAPNRHMLGYIFLCIAFLLN